MVSFYSLNKYYHYNKLTTLNIHVDCFTWKATICVCVSSVHVTISTRPIHPRRTAATRLKERLRNDDDERRGGQETTPASRRNVGSIRFLSVVYCENAYNVLIKCCCCYLKSVVNVPCYRHWGKFYYILSGYMVICNHLRIIGRKSLYNFIPNKNIGSYCVW